MDSHAPRRTKQRRPARAPRRRGSVISAWFDKAVLSELDTYVADRQAESGDRRFRRATAVRELVLLALGMSDRYPRARS